MWIQGLLSPVQKGIEPSNRNSCLPHYPLFTTAASMEADGMEIPFKTSELVVEHCKYNCWVYFVEFII